MKKLTVLLIALLMATLAEPLFSQGFQPPAKGKAVVYFTEVTGYGSGKFEFFHQDRYIGTIKGKNYIRYECNPGENLFWASSENKEFLTSDLQEGKTYIVIVDVVMGFWKPHVGLTPIDESNSELLQRAKDLINKKPALVTPQSKIDKTNKKLRKFIAEELEHYETVTKNKYNFRNISPDMAIPTDKLK